MGKESTADIKRCCVVVTKDRLTASIELRDPDDPVPPTKEEIVAALNEERVVVNDPVIARVEEYVNLASSDEAAPEAFVVAKGQAAKDGKDEEFVWDPVFEKNVQDWQDDAPINYYTANSIVTVEEGDTVGTITPLVPSRSGVDVHGNPITPVRKPQAIELGDTVQRVDEDPPRVIAKVPGRVVYNARRLSIDKVFTVKGDVDFGTGNIDSSIDVVIRGTVRDRFDVRSTKSITIGGAIEAATVHADGDVLVRGGIFCRQAGKVSAEGDIIAKFCSESDLYAKGTIKITKGVMNCRVNVEDKVIAEHGAIIGGYVCAGEEVAVGTVGSDANVATRILVGVQPEALREAIELKESVEKKREAIARIRQSVQPLMLDVKRLTPAQKEQATELLFKADEAEVAIAEAEERHSQILSKTCGANTQRVLITKMVHLHVTISIGDRLTTFQEEMKGPVAIEKRKIDNVTEVVAVNQLTGSVAVLTSMRITLDELLEVFEDRPGLHESSDKGPKK